MNSSIFEVRILAISKLLDIMNILITNIILTNYTGTEVYVRDLSLALTQRGFKVEVYSPQNGEIAQQISNKGINVVDNVEKLKLKPDIIHAHHYIPTLEAVSKFPEVPVVYFQHDRTYLIDAPPKYKRIVKYIAVDFNCLDRLLVDQKIALEKTEVLLNWVDTSRFYPKSLYSTKPKKALVFSNYARNDNYFKIIKEACDSEGIQLDGVGSGLGNSIINPESILNQYDIVFAKAKAAMEALATGASLIVCDFRGLGGMVNSENFDYFRKYNFGMKTMSQDITIDSIKTEIGKYNSQENILLAKKISEDAAFDKYIDQLLKIYEETISLGASYGNEIFKEDLRIINEYQSFKQILLLNPINNLKDQIIEKEKAIKTLENHIIDLNDNLENQNLQFLDDKKLVEDSIKNSVSFKIGSAITYPLRIIYEFLRRKRR